MKSRVTAAAFRHKINDDHTRTFACIKCRGCCAIGPTSRGLKLLGCTAAKHQRNLPIHAARGRVRAGSARSQFCARCLFEKLPVGLAITVTPFSIEACLAQAFAECGLVDRVEHHALVFEVLAKIDV